MTDRAETSQEKGGAPGEGSEYDKVRHLEQMLKRLGPAIQGCLSVFDRRCQNPRCRRCKRGRGHRIVMFMTRTQNERRNIYVPASLIPTIKRAIRNGRKLSAAVSDALAAQSVRWVLAEKEKVRAQRKRRSS